MVKMEKIGKDGNDGETGATGNGISTITKTGTSGLVDTYTITYTNGNTTTYTVTNGAKRRCRNKRNKWTRWLYPSKTELIIGQVLI